MVVATTDPAVERLPVVRTPELLMVVAATDPAVTVPDVDKLPVVRAPVLLMVVAPVIAPFVKNTTPRL